MPLHYGSQLIEHRQVRTNAGMFDVSHMAVVDLRGSRTREFLRWLLANDVARLTVPGKALYSCLLNANGFVLDDLIVYFISEDWFRLVVNASTREKDLAWIQSHALRYEVTVQSRTDLAMIAVQGPEARVRASTCLPSELVSPTSNLDFFQGVAGTQGWFVARTGYTGEDGFEIMLPVEAAAIFWQHLLSEKVLPCGLGARDTLRLEAGMNLYGNDMDEESTPLESGLAWTVAFSPPDRNFVGRAALLAQIEQGLAQKRVGLVLQTRGVMRHGQSIRVPNIGEGVITSGGFSPVLECSIAFARVPVGTNGECEVEIHGHWLPARVVKPPFVRFGTPKIT
ncbi:aminomethyltransferase [Gammaproteobacteria bacterium]